MDDINREQKNQAKTPGLGRDHMLRDEDEAGKRTVSDEKPVPDSEKTENSKWTEKDQQGNSNEKKDS